MRAAAGLPGVRIHDFRHTFATRALRREVPDRRLMRHMGWRSVQMIVRYAHLVDTDIVRVAAAFDEPES